MNLKSVSCAEINIFTADNRNHCYDHIYIYICVYKCIPSVNDPVTYNWIEKLKCQRMETDHIEMVHSYKTHIVNSTHRINIQNIRFEMCNSGWTLQRTIWQAFYLVVIVVSSRIHVIYVTCEHVCTQFKMLKIQIYFFLFVLFS